MVKSGSLRSVYSKWVATASETQVDLVDAIYKTCEDNYENGGDTIVECYTPDEILAEFSSVDDAKAFCGLMTEAESNHRWGEDSDEELRRAERFGDWS